MTALAGVPEACPVEANCSNRFSKGYLSVSMKVL